MPYLLGDTTTDLTPSADFSTVGFDEFAFPRIEYGTMNIVADQLVLSHMTGTQSFGIIAKQTLKSIEASLEDGGHFDMCTFGYVMSVATMAQMFEWTHSQVESDLRLFLGMFNWNAASLSPSDRLHVIKAFLTMPFQFLNDCEETQFSLNNDYTVDPKVHEAAVNFTQNTDFYNGMTLHDTVDHYWDLISDIAHYYTIFDDVALEMINYAMFCEMSEIDHKKSRAPGMIATKLVNLADFMWNPNLDGTTRSERAAARDIPFKF